MRAVIVVQSDGWEETRSGGSGRRARLVKHNIHGENGGATADIENHLVLEQVLVLHNSIHVGSSADLIFLPVSKVSASSTCLSATHRQLGSWTRGVLMRRGRGAKSSPAFPRGCLFALRKCQSVMYDYTTRMDRRIVPWWS